MNSCFECVKAGLDDKGVLCNYYGIPYRVDNPYSKCDMMDEKKGKTEKEVLK